MHRVQKAVVFIGIIAILAIGIGMATRNASVSPSGSALNANIEKGNGSSSNSSIMSSSSSSSSSSSIDCNLQHAIDESGCHNFQVFEYSQCQSIFETCTSGTLCFFGTPCYNICLFDSLACQSAADEVLDNCKCQADKDKAECMGDPPPNC